MIGLFIKLSPLSEWVGGGVKKLEKLSVLLHIESKNYERVGSRAVDYSIPIIIYVIYVY